MVGGGRWAREVGGGVGEYDIPVRVPGTNNNIYILI